MEVDDESKPGDVDECKVDCRQQIPKIMKQHGFFVPYAVEVVRFEPTAQMAIEDGSKICSPYHDELPGDCKDGAVCGSKDGSIRMRDACRHYRFGTLGGFVTDDSGNLFGLTCAHVVDSPCPKHEVYKCEGEIYRRFATSSPKMTFHFGENPSFALVDFAAVQVENGAYKSCNQYIKDEDGLHWSWTVYEGKHSNLVGKRVYKYGAYSGLTRGLIACPDLELPCSDLPCAQTDMYLIMIDNLPDALPQSPNDPDVLPQGPFSKKGDSGSLVCFQHVLSNEQLIRNSEQKTITVLSMIQCGEMEVYGKSSSQSLSFMLATGLRCLFKKSNVNLTCVCPPQQESC
ncbi:uncharacterized protein LOC127857867 isoform X3 [Dreissena polymorpha]|uniref:Peptidase S1 domain-containing protein n=1 Tax=Dreissena polymorpha TaxID=45954 RepID=A0A9D4BUW7_DREPO|nr:uncharacterized protein LOC127857867 isoform X3 [Dreissena polymorpha]XP_052250534.1 uncharacterized protein LOC127857867 isoform X3 [Dreissena polymorpha]XP_052250535.1 uncharacterized protein LOC127857867 isoform X3 [Dreissena polymorpha]KAH3706893.1 hypothetical protein DPMN_066284 [Dreissena polymorpha]